MKQIFDDVSRKCCKLVTKQYSTSFSLGIYFIAKPLRSHIYSIYGFVRLADEIVDSFHGYDQRGLLEEFKYETWKAIERKISLNPILNSFQHVVNSYGIDDALIRQFLISMEVDLTRTTHSEDSFDEYVLGSAEVVGLMCLRVFTEKDDELYERLRPYAQKLGSAFQKVNFLRDLRQDYYVLGRNYFPGVNFIDFSQTDKNNIEHDIEADFSEALIGIRELPSSCKTGVYLAYIYYHDLFKLIKNTPAVEVLSRRLRIGKTKKFAIMLRSFLNIKSGML
jgi:phytoene synthase